MKSNLEYLPLTRELANARKAKHAADARLHAAILAAHAAGISDRMIAEVVHVSHPTIGRAIGRPTKTVRAPGGNRRAI